MPEFKRFINSDATAKSVDNNEKQDHIYSDATSQLPLVEGNGTPIERIHAACDESIRLFGDGIKVNLLSRN